jgi:chemotaxis protein CheD
MIGKVPVKTFGNDRAFPLGNGPFAAPPGIRKEFLHPGQMFASPDSCSVTTIVGSCVAVCLWDAVLHIGGVVHYLLPSFDGTGQSSCRYGNVAIETLIGKLAELGCYPRKLQARIFGGACILQALLSENHIGARNVKVAVDALSAHGIQIITRQVEGRRGRKVVFQTFDGSYTVEQY